MQLGCAYVKLLHKSYHVFEGPPPPRLSLPLLAPALNVLSTQVALVHGHVVVGVLAVCAQHADDEEESHAENGSDDEDGDKESNHGTVAAASGGIDGHVTGEAAVASVAEALGDRVGLVVAADAVAAAEATALASDGALQGAAVHGGHGHRVHAVRGLVC